ncbi:UDP-glucose 4-epimerase [Fusarium oxysporum f. sp. lycopersici 4287]|uniref:UDP-glucose 4-epimerase n=1 Tax=Fusarium oxysporum f. sp. lycopersici (strain 4287 / CBS 123668 / FGSC 9935 / NRRL 34936) TaxID=426428 RepID=A0A0J9W9U6_FUSO4|nr:UDP-glucose 4-epimerase [Fusarium oxysporum f. sp. lycopersici 4287]KNB20119.1 UDP-glucose 4-epimerase [Fusarium oxysporum f. sp. lycopersici 4287]
MSKRIIVTGGSGKTGRYIIESLLSKGHQVLNLDLSPLHNGLDQQVHTLKCDLTDCGQVYSALSSHFKLTEPFGETVNHPPDAVLHLAGIARNMLVPDVETFRVNTLASYNVIEASCRLGVKKIVLASSVCVYGVTYAEGDADFEAFPVDENLDVNPTDVYALSKLCAERTARSFASRFGVDIYAFRIGAVIAPDEYQKMFHGYVNEPEKWKVHGWSYVDVRDLGKMCSLAVDKDGLGFQVFNATNDEITNDRESNGFLKEQCPNTQFRRTMGSQEAPMSNAKIKELLGFREDQSLRTLYNRSDR